jgi:hypothetical protein
LIGLLSGEKARGAQMRLSKGFPGMTVVVAEDRSMCVQPNQVVRTAWVDTDPCRSASKAGRNLYGAFIEQNVNASRILIVESAFDPRNPTRARRAGASEPGQRAGMAILVFGSI